MTDRASMRLVLAAALFAALGCPAFAQSGIGSATTIERDVSGTVSGRTRALATGDGVFSNENIRTANAKGLPPRLVIGRHAVRNALLPVVTVVGFQIAYILSGTIVLETIFALPGIGRLFIDSLGRLDYQVVQSLVVVLSALVVFVNILTDMVYAVVDPRIRIE